MSDDLIRRQDALDAVDVGNLKHFIVDALQNIISEIPSAQPEITEEQVKEYCENRCLIVITSELFHHLKSAQPERCEDCRNFSKARLLIPQPERKKGHWIVINESAGLYECDQCHEWSCCVGKYCMHCGSPMEVEE